MVQSNLKHIQLFEKFIQTATDLRIADSDMFKELVKKYNLKILTTPLQDKRGVVKVQMTDAIPYTTNKTIKRVYVLYPETGYIRGENIDRFRTTKQYVIAKLKPIETKDDMIAMLQRFDKTLRSRVKYSGDVEKWKNLINQNPSNAEKAPLSSLRIIDPKLHDEKMDNLIEYWNNRISTNVEDILKCPEFILNRLDNNLKEISRWCNSIKENAKNIERFYASPQTFENVMRVMLKINPSETETYLKYCPAKYISTLLPMVNPKLKDAAKTGVFD